MRERINTIIMSLVLAMVLGAFGWLFNNVEKVENTEYGTQITFEDGTGYWIEKEE